MTEIINNALTHGGKFHADDVFSSALLRMMNPNIQIIREFKVTQDFDGIVFDIGYGEFDHHQETAEIRENGVPYAAFGLLWKKFGKNLLIQIGCPVEQADKEAIHFDESFVQPLDEDDNTGCGNPIASIIDTFNPSWDSEKSSDKCFDEAVCFANVILRKKLDRMVSVHRAKSLVEEALASSRGNIVVLPQFAPWKSVLMTTSAEFVVYPSQKGGYNAQVVPASKDTNEVKCYFPEEWAGVNEDEIQKISGIQTLTFCHKGRFLISADSLDDIIRACELAHDKASEVKDELQDFVTSKSIGKESV